MINNIEIPAKQRALVFQGGGSLGAYEAGVYHVLYHWIKKDLPDTENVFDIIAGTSIGAVNAVIIINEILEKKKQDESLAKEEKRNKILKYWKETPDKVIQFWKNASSYIGNSLDPWNFYDIYSSFIENYLKNIYGIYRNIFPYLKSFLPSEESFRRYYHTQLSLVFGEPNIFRPLFIYPFSTPIANKFLDYFSPTAKWFQYTNLPLQKSITDSVNSLKDNNTTGIKTIYEEKEPRLLLIAVDIRDAETRTFDSYKENITINHILASTAVPRNYPYVDIDGDKYWDGGILSNTPVREVLSEHSLSWVERLNIDNDTNSHPKKITYEKEKAWFTDTNEENIKKIPKLELSIVNLYPSAENAKQIPSLYDYDLTKDRENDIRFHDKTEYDIKLADVVSDYRDFVERMGQLAVKAIENIKGKDNVVTNLKKEFINILDENQRTLTREGEPRNYLDLLRKRFDIESTIKIERVDDIHTIANKAFDFSSETIFGLIEQGIYDTLDKLYQEVKDKDKESIIEFKKWLISYEKDTNKDLLKPVLNFKKERLS